MAKAPHPGLKDQTLKRMAEQSEKVLTGDGQSPEYDDSDPATYWGKKIGRILGIAVATYLLWHLYSTYLMA